MKSHLALKSYPRTEVRVRWVTIQPLIFSVGGFLHFPYQLPLNLNQISGLVLEKTSKPLSAYYFQNQTSSPLKMFPGSGL